MKKVLLLLANGFEVLEASAFIDVFGWNNLEGDQSTILFTCGLSKEVKSSFNQRFIVDYNIDEIKADEFDALALPGGFEEFGFYDDAYSEKFLQLIHNFKNQGKTIASICVGALPLGKSGILKGVNATTYKNPVRQNALIEFGANVQNQAIVFDDNIISSWNPSTAVDVAFKLLELLTSKSNADEVRALMGFSCR